jgi:hypothetical protein
VKHCDIMTLLRNTTLKFFGHRGKAGSFGRDIRTLQHDCSTRMFGWKLCPAAALDAPQSTRKKATEELVNKYCIFVVRISGRSHDDKALQRDFLALFNAQYGLLRECPNLWCERWSLCNRKNIERTVEG